MKMQVSSRGFLTVVHWTRYACIAVGCCLVALLCQSTLNCASAQSTTAEAASAIADRMQGLPVFGAALYIAAHPDDENTKLLAYLVHQKHFRTGYLSITRGDGGQNLIGSEQGDLLGVIRTQELLAARAIDGAEQFFTRARDFGFSKSPEETLGIWGKEEILADVVWTIRKFRPDVIITRFPTTGEGGHGHHTASAILAVEAFAAAADATRFTEQLKTVQPWQAKRLLWNVFTPGMPANFDTTGLLSLDIGNYNTALGAGYGEIAAKSRSMHKSQGFGIAPSRGSSLEYFKLLAGELTKADIFAGIETRGSWQTKKKALYSQLQTVATTFSTANPAASVPSLSRLLTQLEECRDDIWCNRKAQDVRKLLVAAAALHLDAIAVKANSIPGDKLPIEVRVINQSHTALTVLSVAAEEQTIRLDKKLSYNELLTKQLELRIPPASPEIYTVPYWLKESGEAGHHVVTDQTLVGLPVAAPTFFVTVTVGIGTAAHALQVPVRYTWIDPVDGERSGAPAIVPAVSVSSKTRAVIAKVGQATSITFSLKAETGVTSGTVTLPDPPSGWKLDPQQLPFALKEGEVQELTFHLSAKDDATSFTLLPEVSIATAASAPLYEVRRISYSHIQPQVIARPLALPVQPVAIETESMRIGYLPGAKDEVPQAIQQLGHSVTLLDDALMNTAALREFDTIVVGIRAYNTQANMKRYNTLLMSYVESGGTVIAQYSSQDRLNILKANPGPYPFTISKDRVTDERADVRFTSPEAKLLHVPNEITAADFNGWVQERGLNYATNWDKNYSTVLSMNDPGQPATEGGLLICKHGEGYFVYTGLSFFRQLPAGVPGAYRLFENLLYVGH